MPVPKTTPCKFCSKTIRSDYYPTHCVNNHADEIAELMPAEKKQHRAKTKTPVLTIYSESKSPLLHVCCACKKYNSAESERGGMMNNWTMQHARTSKGCCEQFDRFKLLFETKDAPVNAVVEAPAPAGLPDDAIDRLFAALEEDKEDCDLSEQSYLDFIVESIKSSTKVIKTQAEMWRKRMEKVELAKAEVEEEYRAFKERYAFRLEQRIARAVRTGDKTEAESFNEELNDYDCDEFPKLHSQYNKFLDLCA